MERAAPDGKERASDSPPCCASTTDFTRPRFFFSSRRLHTISLRDWSSDVCSSDLSSPSRSIAERAARADRRSSPSGDSTIDRKSVVKGKSVDLGGRRIIKKKKK